MNQLSESLSESIVDFIERHPPKILKRNLFSVFVEYVHSVGEGTPDNVHEVLWDIQALFKFLDEIEDEMETD